LVAIELLHSLIEGTVSMFKDFEIKDGVFVRKPTADSERIRTPIPNQAEH